MKEYPVEFTEEERLILALSAVLHDIGCIAGKEKHNERTIRILAKKRFDLLRDMLGQLFYRALEQVIIAHSKNFNLNSVSTDPCPEIRLKVISAIFRLADACDISARRVKELLLEVLLEENQLDEKAKEIWKSHLEIENVIVRSIHIKPQVYDLKAAEYCLRNLDEELHSINPILSGYGLPIFILEPDVIERSVLRYP